jgi:hypothetical protein
MSALRHASLRQIAMTGVRAERKQYAAVDPDPEMLSMRGASFQSSQLERGSPRILPGDAERYPFLTQRALRKKSLPPYLPSVPF